MNPVVQLHYYELQEVLDTLSNASDDISEHLQVAKYNLRGERAGDTMPIPNPPQLIHEAGISRSEQVRNRCDALWCKLYKILTENQKELVGSENNQ